MADNKKYKVGITVKEPWADNISYEQLDITLFAAENGGDGCAYVAIKPNIGVRPDQDPTTWIKASQRGQSIYDYCIEYGLFVGTEEEFAQDYADAVQVAKDAATSATHVEEEVSSAEQSRVSAENARVSAESQRASAEESRVSSEAQRSVNETGRVNAEDSRVAAENARVVAENQRASAESTRATNEENRRAEFGGMMRDAETAIGLVDAAITEAENVDATVDGMIVTITDRHGVSKSVNIGFDIYRTYGSVAAMNADAANVEDGKFVMIATLDPTSTENAQLWVRNSNAATSQNPFTFLSDLDQASSAAWADWMENQKPIIVADHTTAVADHTQAISDHTNATNDHAVAGQDHTTAGTDHTQAVSDSTRAGQDHSVAEQDHTRAEGDHTTASNDHSTAQSDHTTAETDHTTASSDHTIASGDHTTALSDHDIALGDHTTAGTDHTRAESDHTTASDDHTRAESDHTLAASDHTTASSDHGIASTDHTTAQGDHTQAGDDHTIASADHANATSDHTLAGNDHTRAESDHSTAVEDNTNAAADHTQAGEDHAQYLLDHDSIASKANVAPNPTDGNVAALDSGGNPIDSGIPSEKVAKTDGFYEGMGVGVAKRLEGNTDVAGSFLVRPTGGDAELANGLAQLNEVQGGSVKFNQLIMANGSQLNKNKGTETIVKDGNFGVTVTYNEKNSGITIHVTSHLVVGRVYIIKIKYRTENGLSFKFGGNDLIVVPSTKNELYSIKTYSTGSVLLIDTSDAVTSERSFWASFQITDLTAIFGAGNEPSTVDEFEAWLDENVGLKDYYDYTDGEVINNNMAGIESNGFNLFNPTTGKARIIGAYSEVYGNYYGIRGTYGTLTFEDDLGNVSTVTPDADGKFELDVSGYLSVADAGNDVAVFLWWDGNKTGYEDYDVEIAHLDVRHIYGKKNGTGELVQVWPTGMPRINDVVDKLCIENGAVVAKRAIGEVDLGSLTWTYVTNYGGRWIAPLTGYKKSGYNAIGHNIVADKYAKAESLNALLSNDVSCIELYGQSDNNRVDVKNGSDSVTPTRHLYYELATPETYTNLVYMGSEHFADGTPVVLPVNYKVDNWGVESILPKNTGTILTAKPTIKVRYAIDAVEQLDTHSDKIEHLYDGLDELNDAKANTVGVYDDLVVGAAKAIAGNQRLDKVFTSMVVEGADGVAKINEVRGKSLVWNQLVNTDTTEVATVNGHKYLTKINGVNSITTSTGAAITINDVSTDQVFDLTKMFGAGNEPATVAEFEKLFPDAYYEYNAGEIINNATEKLDVTGFNLLKLTGRTEYATPKIPTDKWDFLSEDIVVRGMSPNGYISATNIQSCSISESSVVVKTSTVSSSSAYGIGFPIRVLPNTSYYIGGIRTSGAYINISWFDKECYYITYLGNNIINSLVTPPANAYWGIIVFKSNGVNKEATFTNPIVNVSDASRNGTYEPYKHGVVSLNLSTITGKQVGVEDAESVVIFPDGMRQAGSVADTLLVDDDGYARRAVVKTASVDLGTLTWNAIATQANVDYRMRTVISSIKSVISSDVVPNILCAKYKSVSAGLSGTYNRVEGISVDTSNGVIVYDPNYNSADSYTAFKAAMDGVYLIYELATPVEYTLDEPILMTFKAYHGGTIVQSPQAPDSAPMSMNVTFALDAVGTLNNLPKNYISADSMDAFLAQLGTAMNGTWTKSWDAANNRYGFTFTPNAQGE